MAKVQRRPFGLTWAHDSWPRASPSPQWRETHSQDRQALPGELQAARKPNKCIPDFLVLSSRKAEGVIVRSVRSRSWLPGSKRQPCHIRAAWPWVDHLTALFPCLFYEGLKESHFIKMVVIAYKALHIWHSRHTQMFAFNRVEIVIHSSNSYLSNTYGSTLASE